MDTQLEQLYTDARDDVYEYMGTHEADWRNKPDEWDDFKDTMLRILFNSKDKFHDADDLRVYIPDTEEPCEFFCELHDYVREKDIEFGNDKTQPFLKKINLCWYYLGYDIIHDDDLIASYDDNDDESLESEDELECWCCEETKMRKEFCDHKDEKGRTCLSCDEDMINCNKCGNCPTMFYKDAVEIDDYWYCKECAKNL